MNLSFPERIRVDAIIQAAMDMEAAPLLHELAPIGDDETPQAILAGTHKTQRFVLGILDGRTVLVVTSGIGLANAASATARALTLVEAPLVIAAGTTGGLARDINVGDIAAGTRAIYGQADATAFGYAMGQVPQMPVDYTTSDAAVARLANSLRNVQGVDVEPYHPLGKTKCENLGRDYPLADLTFPDKEQVGAWINELAAQTRVSVQQG